MFRCLSQPRLEVQSRELDFHDFMDTLLLDMECCEHIPVTEMPHIINSKWPPVLVFVNKTRYRVSLLQIAKQKIVL